MENHRKILSYFLIDRITDSKATFQWFGRNFPKRLCIEATIPLNGKRHALMGDA
jgi:hypothetical protein